MVSPERRREIGRASYHRRKQPPALSDHLCECGCGSFTFLAPRTSAEKGWVKGEPKRFCHGHNRRRTRETPPAKMCPVCKLEKSASEFYVDESKADGLSQSCKDCRKAASKSWYEANTERARIANQAWKKENYESFRKMRSAGRHKRRARLAQVAYEKIDPAAIYERDGGKCHICGKHVAKQDMSLDHLIPISKGGDHVALNVRLAHLRCNIKRGPGRSPAQLLLT